MYGTTMRSFNVNKAARLNESKKERLINAKENKKKMSRKEAKRLQDKKYMSLNNPVDSATNESIENKRVGEGFSIKDLPIASVIVTVVLTMLMLVMTSGFGGI